MSQRPPAMDPAHPTRSLSGSLGARSCPVCAQGMRAWFRETVLRKYPVQYFYCNGCGLLRTEEPYWLDEAYGSAIAAADTGLLQRNLSIAKVLSVLLFFLFDRRARYLDIAGGYGVLTRLMRDAGFDFYWWDKYCPNLFARGFEAEATQPPFTAVTAFEVLEHVPDPLAFVQEALSAAQTRTLIFSTVLFQRTPPKPRDWWYYAFSTGQHIAFYQARTLRVMAQRLGLRAYTAGSFHVFTDRAMNPAVYRLLASRLAFALYPVIAPWQSSFTMSDHQRLS